MYPISAMNRSDVLPQARTPSLSWRQRLQVRAQAEQERRHRQSVTSPAHNELISFTKQTYSRYVAEPAHHHIAENLDAIVRGDIDRLMILSPPQHGKSELASVRLPPFWLGHHPNKPVAITSYAASLARSKSRQVRDILESYEYAAIFPQVKTRRDSRAVDFWSLASPNRGGVWAGGVGGPITGHGFGLGIIDDPFENWAQAQSEVMRQKVWEWWQATFRTRIWEGGAVVLMMTRWHEDDLAGRLLQAQPGRWRVLRLPAIAETQEQRDDAAKRMGLAVGAPDPIGRAAGAPLCPLRYSKDTLNELKGDVGSLAWAAEYQGDPRAPEGNRIKRTWFQLADKAALGARRVRYWDKAGTAGGGAYTAGVLLAMRGNDVFVEDVVRGQWSAWEREKIILQTAQIDRGKGDVRIYIEQEPGSGGKESAQSTIRNLVGFSVFADRPTGDKDTRLEPFVAQAEAGNVHLVRGMWNTNYLDELTAIPNGRYRDQADATAGAFNKLARSPQKARSWRGI